MFTDHECNWTLLEENTELYSLRKRNAYQTFREYYLKHEKSDEAWEHELVRAELFKQFQYSNYNSSRFNSFAIYWLEKAYEFSSLEAAKGAFQYIKDIGIKPKTLSASSLLNKGVANSLKRNDLEFITLLKENEVQLPSHKSDLRSSDLVTQNISTYQGLELEAKEGTNLILDWYLKELGLLFAQAPEGNKTPTTIINGILSKSEVQLLSKPQLKLEFTDLIKNVGKYISKDSIPSFEKCAEKIAFPFDKFLQHMMQACYVHSNLQGVKALLGKYQEHYSKLPNTVAWGTLASGLNCKGNPQFIGKYINALLDTKLTPPSELTYNLFITSLSFISSSGNAILGFKEQAKELEPILRQLAERKVLNLMEDTDYYLSHELLKSKHLPHLDLVLKLGASITRRKEGSTLLTSVFSTNLGGEIADAINVLIPYLPSGYSEPDTLKFIAEEPKLTDENKYLLLKRLSRQGFPLPTAEEDIKCSPPIHQLLKSLRSLEQKEQEALNTEIELE